MDGYRGTAWLDWWTNSSLRFSTEVTVVISTSEAGWEATAHLVEDDDLQGFEILRDLDPLFSLRFADDSTIPVTVCPLDNNGVGFTLSEYRDEPEDD
ncbi:hypothetical protein [Micromonospora sp. NPDC004704]